MLKNLKTLRSSKTCLIVLTVNLVGCAHATIPKWDGKLYAGDSQRAGISREQDHEFIAAADPAFDEFVAMSYEDLKKFYLIFQSCKQWRKGTPTMSTSEAVSRFNIVIQKHLSEAK